MHPPVSRVVPKSLSHQHIFSVINTKLRRAGGSPPGRLRILDIGCGDGLLISYLQTLLDEFYPETQIEIFGFDVGEVGYRDSQQLPNTIAQLKRDHPQIDWANRVHLQSVARDWRFCDRFFDIAVSNQVLEHVDDLNHFLGNLARVQKPGGFAVHVFPLRSCLVEPHTQMPFVHLVRDHDSQVAFAEFLNRIGLSRYKYDCQVLGYDDPRTHAEDAAKFIQGYTCYRTFAQLHQRCNELGLAVSSHFTKDLYFAKLRQLLSCEQKLEYRPMSWPCMESFATALLKFVASVTLTTTRVSYDIGERIRREKAASTTLNVSPVETRQAA